MISGVFCGAIVTQAVWLIGCAGEGDDASTASAAVSVAAACPSPRTFGAVPNDRNDDRAGLQAALNSGCSPLVLEAGTYTISTPPAPRPVAMLTMPANVEIAGAGDATVIAFAGNAAGRDWRGLQLGNNAVVHRLKIDTAGLTSTNEQTHAIRGDGPLTSPLVEQVTFNHPYRGFDGGDCIQLVGYPDGRMITNPIIRNNNFAVCDRSGVAFHSGIQGGQIANNTFSNTGDQDIDGEGSGDIDGLEIGPGNTFHTGPSAQSASALNLQLSTNIRVHGNTFNGRGMFIYSCSGCELDHNTITQRMAISGGVVEIIKDSAGIHIHDETIIREASAGTGNTIRLVPHNSGTPSDVTIASNQLTQHTNGSMIDTMGIVGLRVAGNTLRYDGEPGESVAVNPTGSSGVHGIRTTDIAIIGNTFIGPFQSAVRLTGSYEGTGTASITNNTSSGAPLGLSCENITTAGRILGPITYAGNSAPAQCGSLVP